MSPLLTLDDRVPLVVNAWARHTHSLHRLFLGYATYGVVLFAALMPSALMVTRHGSTRDLAATGWTPVAMLLAVALNQPLGQVAESRPYATHTGILRLVDVTTDFSSPSDHTVIAEAVAAGLKLADRRLGASAVALGRWAALRRPLVALARWLGAKPVLRSAFSPAVAAGENSVRMAR